MQVFKLCLKILKKNIPSMLIYVSVFLSISIIMTFATANQMDEMSIFTQAKSNIAFISEEDSPLVDGLKRELSKIANFVEIPDKTEALQDALYFREVTYILRVPRGFTRGFMKGEDVQLEKTIVPDSYSDIYVDLAIDKYFNTARLYMQQMEEISQEDLVRRLEQNLSEGTGVELKATARTLGEYDYLNYYFNYFPYALLYILILGMSVLMLVFNNRDLKMRNACSPLSPNSFNTQFVIAVLLFAFVSWLVMTAFCFILDFKNSMSMNTVYFTLNSLAFTIAGACMSFLIGNLAKSRGAIYAASNVVTLGFSFISGVFVPQELLGSSVLKIASFTPTYWYVRANNKIAKLTQFDFVHMWHIYYDMLVQVCFALVFFVLAMVIAKRKRAEP
ncbi:MAG: ABC transporter permease [Clostridiaceae bacterium]|nr:ABC transporter permease [Clostridiaceae bacterium]